MANKSGAAAGSTSMSEAAGKANAPRKGARGAGETKAKGTTRSTRSSTTAGAAAETGTTRKGASKSGTAKGTGNGRARRTAGSGGGAGSSGTGRGAKASGQKSPTALKKDLRDFAGARPDGWSHDDWLRFLDDLQSRGHNINDRDAIGSMLERERLALALERIPGVGPQRVKSIADKYGYLWRLRETDADQLAREANVPKAVAEKVLNGLRH